MGNGYETVEKSSSFAINSLNGSTSMEQANSASGIINIKTDLNNLTDNLYNANTNTDVTNQITDSVNSLQESIARALAQGINVTSAAKANSEFANRVANNTTDNALRENRIFQQQINNKRRMTEINNYYSNMNTQINNIMRNLIIILAIIIVFTILSKRGIIPKDMGNFITFIGIFIIVVYVIYSVYDISIRDRFNFVQYKIPFSQESKEIGQSNGLNSLRDSMWDTLQNRILDGTCAGPDCCDKNTMQYNTGLSRCEQKQLNAE